MSTKSRKRDHIDICLNKNVKFCKTNGFEKYELVHSAIVDFSFSDVDVSTEFLGHRVDAPIIISSMTGGCEKAEKINRNLALAAQKLNIAMSCGSQKAMIEDAKLSSSYIVKNGAPNILYIGNVGLDYLRNRKNFERIKRAIDVIEGDGIFVHLNLAQELVQKEGEKDFCGSIKNLEKFTKFADVPVLVKEVGFGIPGKTAEILESVGVKAIDIAGAGGTSWTKVEKHRQKDSLLADRFSEWGIPTAESLLECKKAVVDLPIIASGGIYDGITACKAFALGADLVGIALPLLSAACKSSHDVEKYLRNFILEIKTAMMLSGVANIKEMKNNKDILKPLTNGDWFNI